MDWEGVPVVSCVICSFPRTGSSLLSYGLADTGLAGHPAEYFGPLDEPRFAQEWNLPARYSLSSYLRSIARKATTENGVAAVKLFVPYLSHLMHRARAEFGAELSESELIEECFPNPRYIFLRRKDRVRQAISFMRALNKMEFERDAITGAAPVADLDPDMDKISSYVETFAEQELQWRNFFERNQITAYEIVYEDLAADYQSTVFGALESLGITAPAGLRLPAPRTVRQSDHATEKLAARYAEYKARVQAEAAGTPAGVLEAMDHQLKSGVSWLKAVTASYLFDITGSAGGLFHVIVREGVGRAGPGGVENPDVTFWMTADTFMRMKSGTIDDGAIAFLNGEVTMYGDQALAISLAPLWFDGVDLTGHI